jgi:hypothetical protein
MSSSTLTNATNLKIIIFTKSNNAMRMRVTVAIECLKGTVQRKLTGVLSGINRKHMISSIAAGYFLIKF